MDAISTGTSKILEFGVSDEDAFSVGLACGGQIRILVEPVGAGSSPEMLSQLVQAVSRRRAIAYVGCTDVWVRNISDPPEYSDRFTADKSGFEPDVTKFIAIHNPPLRLIIVGAVHVAQPLSVMANLMGLDVTVVDPLTAFATPERFPEVSLSTDWPDRALTEIGMDARTAVVTLSHDPKIDGPALVTVLGSDAFYVGSLGSTRTHAKRKDRLTELGFTDDDLFRIRGPVGLNIGAKSPSEIAVSILAQITQDLRSR